MDVVDIKSQDLSSGPAPSVPARPSRKGVGRFQAPLRTKPGLFITATDTDAGKTTVACGILASMRERDRRVRVGVCKPFSTGCRRDREGLVNDDAEALAHFADCRLPLDVINPIRFRQPLSPAAAAEAEGRPVDWPELYRSLARLDESSDAVLVEGAGGLLVPLDPRRPRYMIRELAVDLAYPVLIVCRPGLGTLNHTLMTAELLNQAGAHIVGLVINGHDPDPVAEAADPSLASNAVWLERMTGIKILATVPKARGVDPGKARLDPAITAALGQIDWLSLMQPPGN